MGKLKNLFFFFLGGEQQYKAQLGMFEWPWKSQKKKGLFIDEPQLGKGLAPLIIPEAINKYFVEGIPPEQTIKECTDIKKFCTFQKVDKKFDVFYGGERVPHINRYYMSMYGKPIYKQKLNEQFFK